MLEEIVDEEAEHEWLATKHILDLVHGCIFRLVFVLQDAVDKEN